MSMSGSAQLGLACAPAASAHRRSTRKEILLTNKAGGLTFRRLLAAGVVEIHDAGSTLFQSVRAKVKDADTKSQAAALGLKIFPDGLEEQSTLVRMQAQAACMHTWVSLHACLAEYYRDQELHACVACLRQECRPRRALRFWARRSPCQRYSALPTC